MKERIEARLERLKMSKGELARRMGVRRSAVSNWTAGEKHPERDALPRLADVLQTSTDYLFGRIDDPRPLAELMRLAQQADVAVVVDQPPWVQLLSEQKQTLRAIRILLARHRSPAVYEVRSRKRSSPTPRQLETSVGDTRAPDTE